MYNYFYILLILSSTYCTAQVNLIENGHLEIPNSTICTGLEFNLSNVQNFWNPITTSPDFFHSCNLGSDSMPLNDIMGYQNDYYNENSFVGIVTHFGNITYREYIMCKSYAKLIVNKHYAIKFKCSNADYYGLNTNIGCCLEKDSVNGLVQNNFIPTYPDYTFMTDTVIKDCNNWTEISFDFTPTIQDLQYIVIGVFPETKPLIIDTHSVLDFCSRSIFEDPNLAYYLIDDVRLYCLDCDTSSTCAIAIPDVFTPNADGLNDEWKPLIHTDCTADIDNYLLRIFNRWGEVVFTSHDKNETWKGINNEIGTYVYYLQYDDKQRTQIKQGSVELIR